MSRIRVQCPNCLTPYRQNGRFCSVCGRARDEKSDAEIRAEQTDPNRSLQMAVTVARSFSAPRVPRRSRSANAAPPVPVPAEPPAQRLPTVSPGLIAAVAIAFFGLVWVGRRVNAPQKPTRPVLAPLQVVRPDDAAAKRAARAQKVKEKQDMRDAETYSGDLRAEEAANRLQAELRNGQAPPPSNDPKPFDVIQLPPPVPSGASQTDSQGQAYPSVQQ